MQVNIASILLSLKCIPLYFKAYKTFFQRQTQNIILEIEDFFGDILKHPIDLLALAENPESFVKSFDRECLMLLQFICMHLHFNTINFPVLRRCAQLFSLRCECVNTKFSVKLKYF